MRTHLPLNLGLVENGEQFVPVFAAYIVEPVPEHLWGDRQANRAHFAGYQAASDRIEAELVEAGVDLKTARVAAGSFMAFGFARNYGLDGIRDATRANRAMMALDAWVEAKIQAWNAAQRQRAAA